MKLVCSWWLWAAPRASVLHTLRLAFLFRQGVTNKVQLSTYADAIGSNLGDLMSFLHTEVGGEQPH